MRVDLTIPYQYLCRRKGARKDSTGYGLTTTTVEIPAHAGPAPLVGRFGMPGRLEALEKAGAWDPEKKDDRQKAVFSALDGRPRAVLFFDNDYWVEIGSADDIQARLNRRKEEELDPFAVVRGDVHLWYWRDQAIEDPDALRASGQMKMMVHSQIGEYKACAADRARLDMRVVDGMVVMRTAEPVITALQHTKSDDATRTTYEVVVVPASDTTSTGFKYMEDVGRSGAFKSVPLHRKDEIVDEAYAQARKVESEGGKRTVLRETGSYRNRRTRRVEEKFDIHTTVLDHTSVDVVRPEMLAFDDFKDKAKGASWNLTTENRYYLRHMSKQTGLALLRLMDAREASRGIVTPRLVSAVREASNSLLDGSVLERPAAPPGRWIVDAYNHHAMDEESGRLASMKEAAADFVDALEMRVPGRDWFDHAFDAAADFRNGFAISEICTLTDARGAAAALGMPEISDLALAAARGEGHLIGVRKDKVFQGVLHVVGPADASIIEQVFARSGFEETVLAAAEPLIDRIRKEASVEADLNLGLGAPAFAVA
jgi:hypothetical protein